MMPLASLSHDPHSIINGMIIFLGQDNRSKVQHDFLSDMIPLAPTSASCDANSIVNGTIALPKSTWSKGSATLFFFCHGTPMAPVSALHNADSFINSTFAFLRSRYSKWSATWYFWSCDGIGVTWCQWCHMTPLHSLGQRQSNWDATWLFWSCDAFNKSSTWST